jgi:hopene-associated glycosyltransferase HpnB
MTLLYIAMFSCGVWIYLLAARGGFWRAAQRDDARMALHLEGILWPSVVAIIPARDEASTIGEAIATLLRQDYRGSFSVIVVDDHSGDDTAAVAVRAAAAANAAQRVTVLTAPKLPSGWTGKMWAVHHGVGHAQRLREAPEYLLLTDADIRCASDTLTDLIQRAVREHFVLTSIMAKLRCVSFAERALVPAFVFFFQMLYPFKWVNRATSKTAAAAGGCMLVQCRSLNAAGGIEPIKGELIDDCALARLLKLRGPIWLALSDRVRSVRAYTSIRDIRSMIARCAYAQLQFSPVLLALATAAMVVTFLAPPVLTVFGSGVPQFLGALAWVQMAVAFQPTLRFYSASPLWGIVVPAIAAVYLLFTLDAAFQSLRGRGGEWKGRIHRESSSNEISGHRS